MSVTRLGLCPGQVHPGDVLARTKSEILTVETREGDGWVRFTYTNGRSSEWMPPRGGAYGNDDVWSRIPIERSVPAETVILDADMVAALRADLLRFKSGVFGPAAPGELGKIVTDDSWPAAQAFIVATA